MKFAVVAVVLAGALFVACSGGNKTSEGNSLGAPGSANDPAAVHVKLKNWTVEPSKANVPAGKVSFTAAHDEVHGHGASSEGGEIHELVVAAETALGSGRFDKVMLRIDNLKPGESRTESVDLPAGTYELSCRLGEAVNGKAVSHYEKGMRTTIRVL